MIEVAVLAARLLLAAVMIVAGIAKLLDPVGSRRALEGFNVPGRLIPFLALALPIAECGIAVGLLAVPTVLFAACGALVLLGLFLAGTAVSLHGGRKPECHCFGQLYSEPVGRATILRIGVLAAIAAALTYAAKDTPGPSLFAPLAALSWPVALALAGFGGLALLSAAQSMLIYQLMRQQGRLLLRLDGFTRSEDFARQRPALAQPLAGSGTARRIARNGLPIGSGAPAFRLKDLDGVPVSSAALLAEGKPLLLVFTNPGCSPCAALLPEIMHWGLDPDFPARIVMISEGAPADNLMKFPQVGRMLVLLQEEREVAQAFKANGTPAAVTIRPNGEIGSALATGAGEIQELVTSLVTGVRGDGGAVDRAGLTDPPQPAQTVAVGNSAAALSLRDREGRAVTLARFSGASTLLLFWNASCGFCQRMLDEVRLWAAAPPPGAPVLVMVSMSAHDHLEGLRLPLPVFTDPGAQVSAALGAHGTPTAVLLDPDGRVAAPVAAGARAVFDLAASGTDSAARLGEARHLTTPASGD
jgi:thiol-disulfide isomerase/thioredoxin